MEEALKKSRVKTRIDDKEKGRECAKGKIGSNEKSRLSTTAQERDANVDW